MDLVLEALEEVLFEDDQCDNLTTLSRSMVIEAIAYLKENLECSQCNAKL